MTHERRIIHNHVRIFHSKCSFSKKKALQRSRLTFLTEFAGEAVHTLALLPRPVVQTGAPVSAGVRSAGSFQSRTSTDNEKDKIRRFDKSDAQSPPGGSAQKESQTQMSCDFFPCTAIEKDHKEPQRISILKALSSPHYSSARQKEILRNSVNGFSCRRNLPFIHKKTSFQKLSRGFESVNRCPTARVEKVTEDRQMGRKGSRYGEAKIECCWGRSWVRTCQGCHAMPAPDWAPAGAR